MIAQNATKRGRGRPSYQPSDDDRRAVAEMKFCGDTDAAIALALGIDEKTLRKHFALELGEGRAKCRREVVGLLFDAARSGNVTAMKKLEELGRGQVVEGSVRVDPSLGKKEQQQKAAEGITGKFSPPSAPRLVVKNG